MSASLRLWADASITPPRAWRNRMGSASPSGVGTVFFVKRVLITGMSGTGKSAIVAALAAHGNKAIDTDYGYCKSAADGEWIWNEELVQELLSSEDADVLFIAGCASNQGKFYDQFDLVILLSAPAELMVERIKSRAGNDFGKSPVELAKVLGDLETVEPRLRAGADSEVRTDRPLEVVVEDVVVLTGTL